MYLQNYLQKALGKTNPNEAQKPNIPPPNQNMPQATDSIMESTD
jgi:hypothetical protein